MSYRAKRRTFVCDIDETICTEFDNPIQTACDLVRRIGREVEVHYVTARPEASRRGTEKFFADNRLPWLKNLHICPPWKTSHRHKVETLKRIQEEFEIMLFVGDIEENKEVADEAGVPFLVVSPDNARADWDKVAQTLPRSLWRY